MSRNLSLFMLKSRTISVTFLSLSLGFMGLPLIIHLPNLYQTSGLGIGLIGALIMASRLIDAFLDPLFGRIIDKGHDLRITALLLLALGVPLLLIAPLWGVKASFCLFFGSAFTSLGIGTLLLMLYATHHHFEHKEQVTAWREGFLTLGVIFGAVLMPVFNENLALFNARLAFVAIFALLLLLGLMLFKPYLAPRQTPALLSILKINGIWKILAIYFLNALPTAMTAALFLTFVQDVLKAPAYGAALLLLFFMFLLLGLPPWAYFAKRKAPQKLLLLPLFAAPFVFLMAYFVESQGLMLFAICSALSGLVFAGDQVLFPLILSQKLGEKHEGGMIFGIMALLNKIANALAIGIAFPLVEYFSDVKIGYVIVPIVIKIAVIIFYKFVFKEQNL